MTRDERCPIDGTGPLEERVVALALLLSYMSHRLNITPTEAAEVLRAKEETGHGERSKNDGEIH